MPGRGFHRTATSANGDVIVSEERLRGLLGRAKSSEDYAHGLHELLGTAWELESIVANDAVSSVPAGVTTPTLALDDESFLDGGRHRHHH